MAYCTPKPLVGNELRAYFLEHAKPVVRTRGFYKITKDLPAFKLALSGRRPEPYPYNLPGKAIVNLIIPRGADVYAGPAAFDASYPNAFKMRASKAFVQSIASRDAAKASLDVAHSMWTTFEPRPFVYEPGDIVYPRGAFSPAEYTCASGIHFFLNLRHAYNYDR